MRISENKLQDIFPDSLELAQIMKNDPSFIESSLSEKGNNLIEIYKNPNFKRNKFRAFYELNLEVVRSAIEDLSIGAPVMKNSYFSLVGREKQVQFQIVAQPSPPSVPEGIFYGITLKDKKAELTEDLINAGIYYLTVQLSNMI